MRRLKRLKKSEVTNRRRTVADLVLKGWTQQAIAAHVKVAQCTVARDIEAVRRQWHELALRDFERARSHELQKLALVESEAWAGWLPLTTRRPANSTAWSCACRPSTAKASCAASICRPGTWARFPTGACC